MPISELPAIEWKRYRKLGWFLVRILCHALWWDLILKLPLLRWWRTPPCPRWQPIAQRYCVLATQMGGVPVKLGQFLSLRVDLLPTEVMQTLAVLQDRAPAAPHEAIVAVIEAALARPLPQLFTWFSPQPLASASLAQVHLARLPSDELVAVKILRPGVSRQLEMDMAVIARLIRLLKWVRPIREQIDLDQLLLDFTTVTRRELDLVAEGRNAERFAHDFAADAQVYIPKVYWRYSGTHILTLENVSYLRVNDRCALAAAGIDQSQVAQTLAKVYLQQLFINFFVHADLHPGNLFVKPLPFADERRPRGFAPGEPVPYRPNRPFQIVMIDFGMAVEIPATAQRWLREFIIGMGLRDAQRIVQSYVTGNLLRPGVDREQLEQMTADLLQYFPEALTGLVPDLTHPHARQFMADYEDLLQPYPFQIPMNLLFMYRGLYIVSSLVKQLDPTFDLTTAATPFALQLLWQTWQQEWQGWLQEVATLGRLLVATPPQLDRVLRQAQGVLTVPPSIQQLLPLPKRVYNGQNAHTVKDRQQVQQLARSVERLTWTVAMVGLVLLGSFWFVGDQNNTVGDVLMHSQDRLSLLFFIAPILFVIRFWFIKQ